MGTLPDVVSKGRLVAVADTGRPALFPLTTGSTVNPLALIATAAWIASGPAFGGGVLLCNEYGCRSSPYFPPPIISVGPPAVYVAPNPPQMNTPRQMYQPRLRLWPGEVATPGYSGPPVSPAPPPARVARPYPNDAPARSRPDAPVPDPRADEIEGDILTFCREHPTEGFCTKLTDYLDKHGERRR